MNERTRLDRGTGNEKRKERDWDWARKGREGERENSDNSNPTVNAVSKTSDINDEATAAKTYKRRNLTIEKCNLL